MFGLNADLLLDLALCGVDLQDKRKRSIKKEKIMTLAIRRREYPPSPPPQRHFCLDIFYFFLFFYFLFLFFLQFYCILHLVPMKNIIVQYFCSKMTF